MLWEHYDRLTPSGTESMALKRRHGRPKEQMDWEGLSGTSTSWRFSVWEVHSVICRDKKSVFGRRVGAGLKACDLVVWVQSH